LIFFFFFLAGCFSGIVVGFDYVGGIQGHRYSWEGLIKEGLSFFLF
jgi:hypothetical protein